MYNEQENQEQQGFYEAEQDYVQQDYDENIIDADKDYECQTEEYSEHAEYEPETAECPEVGSMQDEAEYPTDPEECRVLEITADEDDCSVREIVPGEEDCTVNEFMVFAADGTLLNHTTDGSGFSAEPQPIPFDEADADILQELSVHSEPELINVGQDLEASDFSASGAAVTPLSVILNVNVGGRTNIPAAGWTSGNINVTSNTTRNLARSHTRLTTSIALGNWHGNRSFRVIVAQNSSDKRNKYNI